MADPQWYQYSYSEDYLHILTSLPHSRTSIEVDGITRLLGTVPGDSVLDLACGSGRHSLLLAERGYNVTGQDLSTGYLAKARLQADSQDLHVRWINGDMREIPFANEFDAVINVFTSFGYLESEEEDQKVLLQIYKALKPGGRFLLELVHREGLLRHYCRHGISRFDNGGLLVLENRQFDLLSSRNEVQMTMLFADGSRREYCHSLRIYSLTELARMVGYAGLSIQAYYGDLSGSELTIDSFRLVVISRKPA